LDQRFTRAEVVRMTGATRKQLDYWARLGLLCPRARWGERFFSFTDLVAVETLNRLDKRRIPAGRLRKALDQLEKVLGSTRSPLASLRISSNGAEVVVHESGPTDKPIEPMSGQWVLDFETGPLEKKVHALGEHTGEEWFELAMECDANPKTLPRAVEAYRKAIHAVPGWTEAHINLGTTLYQLNLLQESCEAFSKAVELEPGNALAHFNLGCVSERMGDLPGAVEKFSAAIARLPGMADAHLNISMAYDKLGRKADALKHLSLYLRYAPQGTWAAYARKRVNSARPSTPGKLMPFRKENTAKENTRSRGKGK
jgi:tetratricopeptide (TPR) repeat protein